MLRAESDEERLYDQLDQIEVEIAKLNSLGLQDKGLEQIATKLRIALYSYRRLSSNTMIRVARTHDPETFARWNRMWELMKVGKLHPRELRAFHDEIA